MISAPVPASTKPQTIKDRLFILMDTILKDGTLIPPTYHPIIKNVVKGFLQRAEDEQIEKQIKELRDVYLPWLLGEK